MSNTTASPRKGARRKPESPAAVTARGKTFKARQEAMGRAKWEVWITDEEREALKAELRRVRTPAVIRYPTPRRRSGVSKKG